MEIDEIQSDEVPFEKMDTSGERIRFQKIADEFDHVIELLSKYDDSKKPLLNLENDVITPEEFREIEKNRRNFYSKATDILALEKEIYSSAKRPSLVRRIR